MKLCELPVWVRGVIVVKSGYNEKILCRDFNRNRLHECGEREIISLWPEVRATKSVGFKNQAEPVIVVYVNGAKEWEVAHAKDQ